MRKNSGRRLKAELSGIAMPNYHVARLGRLFNSFISAL